MSAMDLSTPKVLDLSVKSTISIPLYKTNHDDQNNDKSIVTNTQNNPEVNAKEVSTADVVKTLENADDVQKDVTEGIKGEVEEYPIAEMSGQSSFYFSKNIEKNIIGGIPGTPASNNEYDQCSNNVLKTEAQLTDLSTNSKLKALDDTAVDNDKKSSEFQLQVKDEPAWGNGDNNFSSTAKPEVKEKIDFQNADCTSQAQLPSQNLNSWPPYSNGHQNFDQNQTTDAHSSVGREFKPDIHNPHYVEYGQQQLSGNFQQFYGNYPQNPNLPTHPWFTRFGFHHNFGAPMWNGYAYPSSPFQYRSQVSGQYEQNSYMQQNFKMENEVKMELNTSNEDTSDLGSSMNSSQDSLNPFEESADMKPTDIFPEDRNRRESTRQAENPYTYDWIPDETLLPKGWKKRVYTNGKPTSHHWFLSPTNERFESKASLVEYMERNLGVFSQDDIEKLKPNGELFSWIPDENLLPKGWKRRVHKNGKRTSHYVFLSPTNEKFNSKTDLLNYMEQNRGLFTESDIFKLRSTMYKGSGTGLKMYTNWDNRDTSLPPGWFKRYSDTLSNGRPHRDYQYLSPKREIFPSRSRVALYMRQNSFAAEDIQRFLSGKVRNGRNGTLNTDEFGNISKKEYTEWDSSDPTLPQGWLKRHSVYVEANGRKHKEYQYLSPNQQKFSSRNSVVAFMTKSGQYSQEDIEIFLSGRGKGSNNSQTEKRNYTEWTDSDSTLPKGWFKRHSIYSDPSGRKHTEYQYLTPNRLKLNSRNAVVAFMTQSGNYAKEVIDMVLSGRGHSSRPNHTGFQ